MRLIFYWKPQQVRMTSSKRSLTTSKINFNKINLAKTQKTDWNHKFIWNYGNEFSKTNQISRTWNYSSAGVKQWFNWSTWWRPLLTYCARWPNVSSNYFWWRNLSDTNCTSLSSQRRPDASVCNVSLDDLSGWPHRHTARISDQSPFRAQFSSPWKCGKHLLR